MSARTELSNGDLEELKRLRRDNELLRAQLERLSVEPKVRSLSELESSTTYLRLAESAKTLYLDDFTVTADESLNSTPIDSEKLITGGRNSSAETLNRSNGAAELSTIPPNISPQPLLAGGDHEGLDGVTDSLSPESNEETTIVNSISNLEPPSLRPTRTPTSINPATALDASDQSTVHSSVSTNSSNSKILSTGLTSNPPQVAVKAPIPPGKSTSSAARQIRIESGLFNELPQHLRISGRQNPCALFVVMNPENGEVDWRFIKDYEQLQNFNSIIKSILYPLLRSGSVKLPNFPPKSYFLRNTPWKVDVRIDMLNTYFQSIAALNTNSSIKKRPKIMSELDDAIAALWLHDMVELPKIATGSTLKTGFLLSRNSISAKWRCNYCVLNGAYLDVVQNSVDGQVTKSISLHRALVIKRIVFFDATEGDERYSIKICERLSTGAYRVHLFSAERDEKRREWLRKLRQCVDRIDKKEISPNYREFAPNKLPSPYQVRQSSYRSAYLPQENLSESHRKNNARSNAGKGHLRNNSIDVAATKSPSRSHSGNKHLAVHDIQNDDGVSNSDQQSLTSSRSENDVFDGGDFYMKISKPMDFQAREDSFGKAISNPIAITKSPSNSSGLGNANYFYGSSPPFGTKGSPTRDNGKTSHGKIFGVPPSSCAYLVTLPNGDRVPSLVARCVAQLEHPISLCELGIFRISGTQTLIDELQEEFDVKGDTNLARKSIDVHTIADLLKRYLRSLSSSFLGEWSEQKSKSTFALSQDQQLKVMRKIIFGLDSPSFCTAHSILELLFKVSSYESCNSMSIWNLSVALSPALKVPAPVAQMFIQNQKELFANAPNKKNIHIPTTIPPPSL